MSAPSGLVTICSLNVEGSEGCMCESTMPIVAYQRGTISYRNSLTAGCRHCTMNTVHIMGVQERRARQKESIREEILDAARTLFVKEGYEHVSMRKIAEKIEYAPGTIYLYFRDKAEIFDRLCEETFAKLAQKIQAINADPSNPLEGLRRGLRTYIQFGIDNPNHYIVTFVQAKQIPREHEPKAGEQCFDNLRSVVTRCIEAGQLNCEDAEEVAQALWTGAHGVVTLLITCNFPFIEQSRLIDRVLHILIEGIRKR
jgi:AcrR family transcriptional regulator